MAITLLTPNGGEYFYAHYNGTDTNTINNVISWTADTNDNVTISYSTDGGSTWTTLASGITSLIGTVNYNWSLTLGQWNTLLSGVDEHTTMKIKVSDGSTNDQSDANFTLRNVTIGNICPNSTDNNPTSAKIFNNSFVNLIWEELWTANLGGNVKIDYRTKVNLGDSFGSWTELISSTPNDGSYAFVPKDKGFTASSVYVQFRITHLNANHVNNIAYSENSDDSTTGIVICDNYIDSGVVDSTSQVDKFPTRFDTFARTSGEKAIWADEFITLSQLEAGEGIEIIQRDNDGKDDSGKNRSGGTTSDPFVSHNIIIRAKDNAVAPRELTGIIDFLTEGMNVAAPGNYYGRVVYKDIVHNWGLTSITANVGKMKYHLEMDEYYPETNLIYTNVPQWEAIDENTIRVYCTIKGTVTDPIANATVDSQVTLSKDRLNIEAGKYRFYWRLKEIIG